MYGWIENKMKFNGAFVFNPSLYTSEHLMLVYYSFPVTFLDSSLVSEYFCMFHWNHFNAQDNEQIS